MCAISMENCIEQQQIKKKTNKSSSKEKKLKWNYKLYTEIKNQQLYYAFQLYFHLHLQKYYTLRAWWNANKQHFFVHNFVMSEKTVKLQRKNYSNMSLFAGTKINIEKAATKKRFRWRKRSTEKKMIRLGWWIK